MRKLIVSTYVTLDSVMEAPGWSMPFWGEDSAAFAHEQLFACDALLLGRVTYQGFAAAWPSITDEEGFADRMNSLPKFVVSTTLQALEWNNSRRISGNVLEEVASLKQQLGGDILMYGSAGLMNALTPHGLIDEYRFWVHPVVVGGGKRLFTDGTSTTLKLSGTKTLNSGVVILSYGPADTKQSV